MQVEQPVAGGHLGAVDRPELFRAVQIRVLAAHPVDHELPGLRRRAALDLAEHGVVTALVQRRAALLHELGGLLGGQRVVLVAGGNVVVHEVRCFLLHRGHIIEQRSLLIRGVIHGGRGLRGDKRRHVPALWRHGDAVLLLQRQQNATERVVLHLGPAQRLAAGHEVVVRDVGQQAARVALALVIPERHERGEHGHAVHLRVVEHEKRGLRLVHGGGAAVGREDHPNDAGEVEHARVIAERLDPLLDNRVRLLLTAAHLLHGVRVELRLVVDEACDRLLVSVGGALRVAVVAVVAVLVIGSNLGVAHVAGLVARRRGAPALLLRLRVLVGVAVRGEALVDIDSGRSVLVRRQRKVVVCSAFSTAVMITSDREVAVDSGGEEGAVGAGPRGRGHSRTGGHLDSRARVGAQTPCGRRRATFPCPAHFFLPRSGV